MLSPLLVFYTLWRARKDGGKRYLQQRLGFYSDNQAVTDDEARLWIHAASVGEVFTVLPLLKAVKTKLLVTTMSPTGAAVLQRQGLQHVQHQYLPIDVPGACRRFFEQANVHEGWIVETEIWPWLYACAHQHQVSLSIINARLSDRTSKRARGFMASTFQRALNDVQILARSEDDAKRFTDLGSVPSSVSVVGNLKYAADDTADQEQPLPALTDKAYVLAASTHANEEEQLALAWQELQNKADKPKLLVIAPRHPERGPAIQKQLASHGIEAALRSKQEKIGANALCYIADTLGELQSWYASADACFVGGSLIKRGGHNVLEAARLGCAIVVGPHTANFADIVSTLENGQALELAKSADDVVALLNDISADPQAYAPMVKRAKDQARLSEGVLKQYLKLLVK